MDSRVKRRKIMKEIAPYSDSYFPPHPTEFTVKSRQNLLYQFYRFLVINLKMLKMTRYH